MPPARRKPFSNKQKKEQLKAKRERKRNKNEDSSTSETEKEEEQPEESQPHVNVNALAAKNIATKLINYQPSKSTATNSRDFNPNRFNLHFLKDSQEELNKQKKYATKPLNFKSEQDLEVDIYDVYKPDSPLDMPIRPKWSYDQTKDQIEQQERNYFSKYLNQIFESYKLDELSYFEMNLETWRQLWRVLEISDILLLIVDIRYPALHFSPVFYKYCTESLKKDVIVVLNKIDLVPTSLVIAWKHYFMNLFPKIHILMFSSSKQIKYKKRKSGAASKSSSVQQEEIDDEQLVKALAAEILTARAHRELYSCVKNIVQDNVDLTSWDALTDDLIKKSTTKLNEQFSNESLESARSRLADDLTLSTSDTKIMEDLISDKISRKRFDHGFVTIGCCGFPNVGKSSLLNSLNGKKVVSVSKTPGHTKHLQTIFLTKTVRLCDCPGLVFPSLVCKPLQVLAGIYPIAQLQEPYSAIRYLSERIPIFDILNLRHPLKTYLEADQVEQLKDKDIKWSPLDVCEAWAIKRGYITAKASRPDVYRAANEILRMALDGRLCLMLKPKEYSLNKETWNDHSETKQLNDIVNKVEQMAREHRHAESRYVSIKKDPLAFSDLLNSDEEDDEENDDGLNSDENQLTRNRYFFNENEETENKETESDN